MREAVPGGGGGGAWLRRRPGEKMRHTDAGFGRDGKTGGLLVENDSGNDPAYYYKKQQAERQAGRQLSNEEFERDYYQPGDSYASGTSIFDPVLCELAYRWFSPPGGLVIDPFAGGSVRGIVAAALGRRYIGYDLSQRQIDANYVQCAAIGPQLPGGIAPQWICADSATIDQLQAPPADLIFTCPPYHDLEQYSDDPRDLSAMGWDSFVGAYQEILAGACARLAPDRFAVIVVGDVRGPDGYYRDLPGLTIRAMERAGCRLYNEAILVTAVGSLAVRVGRQMERARKLGKTHQNVLVFCNGDPARATAACGPVTVELPTAADN